MGSRNTIFKALASAGAVAALAAVASAPASAATGAVPSLEKLVPAKVKSAGSLTVAADATYAPDEFMSGGKVVGMDADLSAAIGKVLGLKVSLKNVTFDDIIPSMLSGRFEVGASSFTDTKAREKQVSFVDYANVGESFYTLAQGGTNISGIAGLCGLTVSVEAGTTEDDDATAQKTKCAKAGKKAVTVAVFPDQSSANLAVSDGHAQVGFADTPVAAYQVKQSDGKFKLTGKAYAVNPYGIAIAKDSGLTPAVEAAVKYLVKNGTYGQIFKKWGVASIEDTAAQIKVNGALS